MVCAIVKVLPEPVTPSRTWCLSPRSSPVTSSPIARSWSPASEKSETRLKRSYKEGIRTHHGTRGWGWGLGGQVLPLEGGEIAFAGTHTQVPAVLARHLDLDLAPGAIG